MWNKLSMNDRAAIIKLAVSNGITNLDEIRKVYNKYAEGGPLKTDNTPWKKHLLKIASDIDNKYLGGEGMAAYNKKVQQEKNRRITDEEVVDSYIDNVLYTMENPNNTGYKDDKYYPYADSSSPKNLGPGINYTSDMAEGLDFSGKKGYTKEELNEKIRPHLLENMEGIMSDLYDMYGEEQEVWKNYFSSEEPKFEKEQTLDFITWLKKLDLDTIQEGVQNIQRVIGVIGDISTQKEEEKNYTPRPLYKHFDD